MTQIRGERLEQLPSVERWSQSEFRRYLLERWEREWPKAQALLEERILVALELWPKDLDYRLETLRSTVEETYAAYLEERDTIAVLQPGEVSSSTLIHELAHALQTQRWGALPTPRTFEAQFLQTAWLEREAVLVEGYFRGEEQVDMSRAAKSSQRDFPRARPPAHSWLSEDPGLVGPIGSGRTQVEVSSSPHPGNPFHDPRPRARDPEAEALKAPPRGWSGLPYGAPPTDPRWPSGRSLGHVGANDQIIGQRGFAWWSKLVPELEPLGQMAKQRDPGWCWVDDRLRIGPRELVWRIEVGASAAALAEHLGARRPKLEVHAAEGVVTIRLPLPPVSPGR